MPKTIYHDNEALDRLIGGAKILHDAVRVTYGPLGRNVIIEKQYGDPIITHDGVTVAENVYIDETAPENHGKMTGINLIRAASKKLNRDAGDGTTSVTILTYSIMEKCRNLIQMGHSPMLMKQGIEDAARDAAKYVGELAKEISPESEELRQIAVISAGDEHIGRVVSSVIAAVGENGTVTVEAQGRETKPEIREGYIVPKGIASHKFMTDFGRQEGVIEDANIFVSEKKYVTMQSIAPVTMAVSKGGMDNLVLICEEVSGEALAALENIQSQGSFRFIVVKAPSYGDNRLAILNDIAVSVGAKAVTENLNAAMVEANPAVVLDRIGHADRVVAGLDDTSIVGGRFVPEDYDGRVNSLEKQLENADTEYDKDLLRKRLASMRGKVAVIKVGGLSDEEIAEKKYRVDDAVAAARAALSDGIVPGGGMVTLLAHRWLDTAEIKGSAEYKAGYRAVIGSLPALFTQLLENAGKLDAVEPGTSAKIYIERALDTGKIIDVKTGKWVFPLKAGIVDPARVTKDVISSAASIAAATITAGALMADNK